MKNLILITADLHDDRPQFQWLEDNAPRYGLTIAAGDLFDMFSVSRSPAQQRAFLQDWALRVADAGAWLAITDGNHDVFEKSAQYAKFPPSHARLLGPNETRTIDDLCIVTCLSWNPDTWPKPREFQRLDQLREDSGLPWILVAHLPPTQSRLADGHIADGFDVDSIISEYKPDFLVCGHIHEAPYVFGQAHEQLGETLVLNPGRSSDPSPVPNHIILDPHKRRHSWESF